LKSGVDDYVPANGWNAQYRRFASRADKTAKVDDRLLLSAFLSAKAFAPLKSAYYGSNPKTRAAGKRRVRELRTAFVARAIPQKDQRHQLSKRPGILLYRKKPNVLRDTLCPDFHDRFQPVARRLRESRDASVDLRDFSFAKAPAPTMAMLANLGNACATSLDVRLNFLDDCDDVTPYVVLSLLRPNLPPVISGGEITRAVRDVVDAVGMRSALRINSIGRAGRQRARGEGYSVSAFPMARRTPPGAFGDRDHQLRPQYKEYVADQFVDTINEWIGKHDLELVPEAAGNFISAITEALDNAERHGDAVEGDMEGDWSISAFSKLVDVDGRQLWHCSIGIVSIGATISQSLESADEEVASLIHRYCRGHSGIVANKHKRDSLRTVMALQDGITRDRRASAHRRGGVGFMELIEVIAELGENDLRDRR
jgi:hypothetical protein